MIKDGLQKVILHHFDTRINLMFEITAVIIYARHKQMVRTEQRERAGACDFGMLLRDKKCIYTFSLKTAHTGQWTPNALLQGHMR